VISVDHLLAQEAAFARAFAARDLTLVRDRYAADVVYLSPTVRLFDWPRRIEGVDRTLEFIALTIRRCEAIRYEAVQWAIAPGGESAFVLVHFDWTLGGRRLRSRYVVVYRYRDGRRIVQQEVCYDPSAPPEVLEGGGGSG
jgi:ketosteroid isomerase-like protein